MLEGIAPVPLASGNQAISAKGSASTLNMRGLDPGAPQPTGTFRQMDKSADEDGWQDLGFGNDEPLNSNRGSRFGATGTSFRSGGGKKDEDEFDLVDNILDDLEDKKGIESTKRADGVQQKERAKTAGPSNNRTKESLWSAAQGADPNSHNEIDDLADIEEPQAMDSARK